MRTIERIAIVNRGEAAMRLIHAARELRDGSSGQRVSTVALYTDPDQRAMFVREADAAVGLGAATFVDPKDGRRVRKMCTRFMRRVSWGRRTCAKFRRRRRR